MFWNSKEEMLKETKDRVYAEIEKKVPDTPALHWGREEIQHWPEATNLQSMNKMCFFYKPSLQIGRREWGDEGRGTGWGDWRTLHVTDYPLYCNLIHSNMARLTPRTLLHLPSLTSTFQYFHSFRQHLSTVHHIREVSLHFIFPLQPPHVLWAEN